MPPLNGALRIQDMATKTVAPARKKPRASAPAKKAKKPAAKTKAAVAQPAEHLPSTQGVAGSSPAGRSSLPSDRLNPRHRAFVVEYLKDKNATQAYMRVYGVGRESAERAGPRLLGVVGVRTEIDRLERLQLEQVQRDTGISLERTLRTIAAGAYYDPRKFYHPDGSLKAIHELDDETALALSGFEVSEIDVGGNVIGSLKKIKMANRQGFNDMLMKHFGAYLKDNEQTGKAAGAALAAGLAVRFVEPGQQ